MSDSIVHVSATPSISILFLISEFKDLGNIEQFLVVIIIFGNLIFMLLSKAERYGML